MKKLILLISLILSFSFSLAGAESSKDSVKVISRGYGSDYDEQLLNAQISALSNAVGSFIIGDTVFNSEKIRFRLGKTFISFELWDGGSAIRENEKSRRYCSRRR